RTLDAQSSAFFQKANLTPTQFSVLEVLYSKGSMRINKLIGSLLATSGNMTVVLKNMERNGWISRCQDAKDKRACLVQLTPEGKALIETILPEHIKRVEALFSVLTETEQKQLITLLKKFKEL
ncbi:TPA: MarR family transcriptional regulator, partial [Streptococcus equi subsp. zooepidemicus]|nr:MarR family transcriptional regulator [Streptococcus equi subsp. zooepidemicus]